MDGSYSTSCDQTTGQCRCRNGVIGRQCNQCDSRFAQVTTRGCEVVYDSCPTNFVKGIWWQSETYGQMAKQACPMGSVGMATRFCDEKNLWMEPDMSACTSTDFVGLTKQVSTGFSETCYGHFNTGFSMCIICVVVKDKFLHSAVSSPQDGSRQLTLYSLADLFNRTPSQLLWEASSHAAINAQRLFVH